MSDAPGIANAQQIEYWNSEESRSWVVEQDRYRRMLAPFTDALVGRLALEPGERVVDVGCGFGDTTLAYGQAVGADGAALGVDISGPMLDVARKRAADAGLAHVRFEQADAQVFDFPAGAFDAAASRFGVMFFDDPVAAFANVGRALRAGGRMTFACWQSPLTNEWITVIVGAIVQHLGMPDMGEPGAPGPFALADADRVRSILGDAGWTGVEVEPFDAKMWLAPGVDDAIAFFMRTDMAKRMIGDAPEDKVQAAVASARDAASAYVTGEGLELGSSAWLVSARRP